MSVVRSVGVASAVLLTALALARPQDGGGVRGSGVPALSARLASLDPSAPLGYFELAEEAAYELQSPRGLRLARELYVLAFALRDRAEGEAGAHLGRSACLGLADLSTDAEERRWLLALASTLAPSSSSPRWVVEHAQRGADESALALAELLGDVRRYENGRLRRGARQFDVEQMLIEEGVNADDAKALDTEIVVASSRPAKCSVCRNDRVTRSRAGAIRDVELCERCLGNPGGELSPGAYMLHLRAEAALLGAEINSWSGELLVSGARPLRDVDPSELTAHFGVDAALTVWSPGDGEAAGGVPAGSWTAPAGDG